MPPYAVRSCRSRHHQHVYSSWLAAGSVRCSVPADVDVARWAGGSPVVGSVSRQQIDRQASPPPCRKYRSSTVVTGPSRHTAGCQRGLAAEPPWYR